MKAMGIDYGEARIGVALSDLLKMLASPYTTYHTKGAEQDVQFFLDLIKKEKVRKNGKKFPIYVMIQEQMKFSY